MGVFVYGCGDKVFHIIIIVVEDYHLILNGVKLTTPSFGTFLPNRYIKHMFASMVRPQVIHTPTNGEIYNTPHSFGG